MFTVTFYFQLFSLLNFLTIYHFVCHLCTNDDHIFWLSILGHKLVYLLARTKSVYSILSMSHMHVKL